MSVVLTSAIQLGIVIGSLILFSAIMLRVILTNALVPSGLFLLENSKNFV
jgi:hypothetical protein